MLRDFAQAALVVVRLGEDMRQSQVGVREEGRHAVHQGGGIPHLFAVLAHEVEREGADVFGGEELAGLAPLGQSRDLERLDRGEVVARDGDHLRLRLRDVEQFLPAEPLHPRRLLGRTVCARPLGESVGRLLRESGLRNARYGCGGYKRRRNASSWSIKPSRTSPGIVCRWIRSLSRCSRSSTSRFTSRAKKRSGMLSALSR